MSRSVCYLNGRYLDTDSATVPATDRGFLYGEGLFESWRTYRGRPFAVREHLARLAAAARALGIPFDAREPWEARSRTLLRRNGMDGAGAVVRLTITRGAGPLRLAPPRAKRPTRLMLVRALEPGLALARERGVAVHLFDGGGAADPALRSLKTTNYLSAVLGKSAAAARGCFEAIYRMPDGTLLEGTTSNLFVVRRGVVATPPLAAGLLPGVTRALVLGIARREARVREARVTARDLAGADEAFLTASSIEIVPIVRVERRKVGTGEPGPLTRELQQRYRAMVARRVGLPVGELGE